MEKNEIKKALYREKPIAKLVIRDNVFLKRGIVTYVAYLSNYEVLFEVKVSELGDAPLLIEMDAKLLIRYLV